MEVQYEEARSVEVQVLCSASAVGVQSVEAQVLCRRKSFFSCKSRRVLSVVCLDFCLTLCLIV